MYRNNGLCCFHSKAIFITKTQYDGSHTDMISTQEVEGYNFRTQLLECPKNYMAFNLNRNERVNSRGVELHLSRIHAQLGEVSANTHDPEKFVLAAARTESSS